MAFPDAAGAFYGSSRRRSTIGFWTHSIGGENSILAAVFNLNEPAHVVHWHFFEMSVANVAVIVAMLVVFALAILLPFPGSARRQRAREQSSGGGSDGLPSPPRPITGQPTATRIEVEP